ncbi:MAG: response regulator, partial [Zetaproteobacteria bacterium]
DNGCGIPQEHLPHLFEPFFTTKEVGKGTGLGLAMVFGAMHSHHGTVTVESTEGEGTTVCAWLPLLSPQEREPERTEEEETTQDAQQATILLADDEKLVLDASAEVLEALGYRVLRARNGNEVLERFARHREEIDLAILDLVMPDCGGDLAAIRLRRQAPALPIILITGYDYEHLKQGRPLPEGCTLMTKPVDYDRLHRRIQKLLRGRS